MPIRSYYQSDVATFLSDDSESILGALAVAHHYTLEQAQTYAWRAEIEILKSALMGVGTGEVFLEFYIPRMGKRVDAVLLSTRIVFVIEFKVGASEFVSSAFDQVEDYALDLKNFHEGSHNVAIIPVLVATDAPSRQIPELVFADDFVTQPVGVNAVQLESFLKKCCDEADWQEIDSLAWRSSGYRPTPTIVEAAEVLYRTHSVSDISRSDAGAKNLRDTSAAVSAVIEESRSKLRKSICFVTGVPGSGKTLAGLNIATQRHEEHREDHAVFLSGNGPLVDVLREALSRDRAKSEGVTKESAKRQVSSFVQNIHHFRDEYLQSEAAPTEKVVVFDEAQRAWTLEQAASFMKQKRGRAHFNMSEPEFLLSVMDRHDDWCTVICLIGGGQEINTGEAGITEWLRALELRFPNWDVYVSPRVEASEYGSSAEMRQFLASSRVHCSDDLHLAVSMRSFRAEALSTFVGYLVDNETEKAREAFSQIRAEYPIYITRDLGRARAWLMERARGTERYGLVASSGAQRLRPEGIHIKSRMSPADWFLNPRSDVRSSYYLEIVASQFDVQGLELDWVGVCWDADFRFHRGEWHYWNFSGTQWKSVRDASDKLYLKNAYRVLLTRARQGMVVFIPRGNDADYTRPRAFYDATFGYLKACGLPTLD